jgi:hypothetical protein
MKINLVNQGSKSNSNHVKLVYWLASEMASDYSMSQHDAIMYFIMDGIPDLCNWIGKQHHVKATPWKFGTEDNIIGAGIDFEDSADLTKLLLKMPSGKLSIAR